MSPYVGALLHWHYHFLGHVSRPSLHRSTPIGLQLSVLHVLTPCVQTCMPWHPVYALTPCVRPDTLCTSWHPVYALTPCVRPDTLCTSWHPVYVLTPCIRPDTLCTSWHPVYALTPCVCPDTLCTSWHSVYALTPCVHPDTLYTPWHPVYALTPCVRPDTLCTSWHSVYALTPCVHPDTLCTPWHPVYALTPCVRPDTLCTPWHSVYALTLCVRPDTLCTPWHHVYILTPCIRPDTLCTPWHYVYVLTFCVCPDTLCTSWHCVCPDTLCTSWHPVYVLTPYVCPDTLCMMLYIVPNAISLYDIVYPVTPCMTLYHVNPSVWPHATCLLLYDLSVWPCVTQFSYCFSSHCAQASELPPSPHVWEWPPTPTKQSSSCCLTRPVTISSQGTKCDGFPIVWTGSSTLWSVRHHRDVSKLTTTSQWPTQGCHSTSDIVYTARRMSFDVSSLLIAQQAPRVTSRVIDCHFMRCPMQYQCVFIMFNCTFPLRRSSPGANGERCHEYNAKTRATFSSWCSHEVTVCHRINQMSPLVLKLVDPACHMTDGECTNHVSHSPQNEVGHFCNVFNA